MNTIIFGSESPKIDYNVDPKEGADFAIKNEKHLSFSRPISFLSWEDLGEGVGSVKTDHPLFPAFMGRHRDTSMGDIEIDGLDYFINLFQYFKEISGSESDHEAKFLALYINECFRKSVPTGKLKDPDYDVSEDDYRIDVLWESRALIPQVWVNIPYPDSRSSKRAERAENEAFRVDFMLIDDRISESPTIIEIDGKTHFGYWGENEAGEPRFRPSLEEYTRHLKKDRWLRNQGWNVVRISNQEVDWIENEVDSEDGENFGSWFSEITTGSRTAHGGSPGIPF